MRQIPDPNIQRLRNGNHCACRTNCSLIFSSIGAIFCLFVLIAAVAGLVYSSDYFDEWTETTATVVGTNETKVFEHNDDLPFNNDFNTQHCPKVQFVTVGEDPPQNVTAILEVDCKENAEEIDLGVSVDILYDPSDPTDVVDASVPDIVEVALVCVIGVSSVCSCCYVMAGIIFHKVTKDRNKRNSGQFFDAENTNANNHSASSSVQMANLNENNNNTHRQYAADPNEFRNTTDTTPADPVQSAPSDIPVAALGGQAQPEEAPPMVSVYPEGRPAGTAIAVGDEAPPIVGCTLIPSSSAPSQPSNQDYVNSSSLPVNSQAHTSSYVTLSDIREGITSA